MKVISQTTAFVVCCFVIVLMNLIGCPTSPSQKTIVPDVTTLPESAARTTIESAGLSVGTVVQQYNATFAAGRVICTEPTAGSAVFRNTSVNIIVSEGNQPDNVSTVMVIDFDPILESRGNQRLHTFAGWNDPKELSEHYSQRLLEATNGHIGHRIVEWIELDEWPQRVDGFRYTDDTWLTIYEHEPRNWPDERLPYIEENYFDIQNIIERYKVIDKVRSGEIDELWVFTGAFPGNIGFESRMAGKDSYWCNGPVIGNYDCRPFLVYGFNYERDIDCMLENTGHAIENIMNHTFTRWDYTVPLQQMNKWERFTLYDKVSPGNAACGSVHYAPNSSTDYDWSNNRPVQTTYVDWYDYPHLTGKSVSANCKAWGNGSMEGHHLWWLGLIPRAEGIDGTGYLNDWWGYYLYPPGLSRSFLGTAYASNITLPGEAIQTITMEYRAPFRLDTTTLDDADLLVRGPGGWIGTTHLKAKRSLDLGYSIIATYELGAPGETWDTSDIGRYTIEVLSNEVHDNSGTSLSAGVAGEFWVGSVKSRNVVEDPTVTWSGRAEAASVTLTRGNAPGISSSNVLHLVTDSGGDVVIIGEPTVPWNLTSASALILSIYASNPNLGFQNGSPWIMLFDRTGNSVMYQHFSNGYLVDMLNEARGQWMEITVPIRANESVWHRTLSGEMDFSMISRIEIHADTWGYGFQLWVNNVSFEMWGAFDVTRNAK